MTLGLFKLYGLNDSGVTAIEFSLLALPFTLCIVAIIELSMFFATATVIEGSLQSVTRLVRTGQIQQAASLSDMEDMFKEAVCAHGDVITNCDAFQYEVRKLDSFASDITLTVDEDGRMNNAEFSVDQVTAGCTALLRLTYLYDFITPLFGTLWSNYPGSKRLIVATTVVKSEPYDFNVATNCDIG